MLRTDRQLAMLRAMGLRVWHQPAAVHQPAAASPPTPVIAAASAAAIEPATLPLPAAPTVAKLGPAQTLDWPALRDAVAACRACALCDTRKQTVFGAGHPQAHWMVIGEAPGAQEDEQGEPFVGAAGQLLDSMLRALGLSRALDAEPQRAVYIANTLKCRPPGNRNPLPEEMARCEPFLQRQIELLQPRMILAMGAFAVRALLRSTEPVGKLRGRVHRFHGVPLVVTYHPAYLLRTPAEKARAWDDLCLAASVLDAAAG
jgi:DNA polymerase